MKATTMDDVVLYWAECLTCGYDSAEANFLDASPLKKSICPICAADCGHSNELSYRPATQAEIGTIPNLPAAEQMQARKAERSREKDELDRLRGLRSAALTWYSQGPATDWRQDEVLRAAILESRNKELG